MVQAVGSIQIQLLGGFRVLRSGETVLDAGWNRRKALALLKLIAGSPNGQLHREQVCEALWPDLDPRAATNNLHKNLHYLRTALAHDDDAGAPQVLLLNGDVVRLGDGVEVDLREGLVAAHEARGSDDVAAFDRALDLLGRELLPEDAYEEWVAALRDEVTTTRAELLREVATLHIRARRWDDATERTRDLLEVESTDEDAHRALMQLYVRAGSRHRALRQFELCREALQAELGIEPSAQTVALYEKLLEEAPAAPAGGAPGTVALGAELSAPTPLPAAERPLTYGREHELEAIEDALDASIDGRGTMLFLLGEAGIGKSHLLRHVRAAAEEQGALALYGRAYEIDAHVPYQPLRGVLRELMQSPAGGRAQALVQRSLFVRRLLPEAPVEPVGAADTSDLQAALFEELWRVFAGVAAEQPLVLLLDDLHDADEGSLRAVHLLARRAPEARLLIVGAARPERTVGRDVLGALRAALRRDQVTREVALLPLETPALGMVVQGVFEGGSVDRPLLNEVIERSAGNPLFARELASTYVDEGWARIERGRWHRRGSVPAPAPAAARELLDRRFERLSDFARDLVHAAAVTSTASSFAVLQAVSGLDRRMALDALDECISASLLDEDDGRYRFRHELVREAAYASLTTARRQQLHHAYADALLASPSGADPGIVGLHLVEGDEPWLAVSYLLESAQRTESVFAHEQAKETLERAVQLARGHQALIDPVLAARTVEALGDVERRVGHLDASVSLFEEAARRFEAAGNGESSARARGKAALGHIIRGDAEAAQRHIEDTLRSLTEQSGQHVVSRTYYLLAQLHWHSGENQAALDAAKQALLAAEESDDPAQQAQAFEVMALACHSLGDWQQGVEYELRRQAIGVSGFDTDEAFDAHL